MGRLFLMVGLVLLLAACGSDAPAGGTGSGGEIINWDRDPRTVVFRADVIGGSGSREFLARNDLPLCTVYGDNRVVWLNDLGDFNVQVLWDKVTDEQIRNFVSYLTVVERIYTTEGQAAQQVPGETAPVYEQLSLFVNGREHTTDAFAGWDDEYFMRLVETCRTISVTPVLYEPAEGWVSAREIPYDPNRASLLWDGTAAGLRLGELAASGEPRWVRGNNAAILWNLVHTSSPMIQFIEGEQAYEVVLEVPGIHPAAPPAP